MYSRKNFIEFLLTNKVVHTGNAPMIMHKKYLDA